MSNVVCRRSLRGVPCPRRRNRASIGLVVLFATALASCAHHSITPAPTPDISSLEMNPSKFVAITLRTDVEVKVTVIDTATAARTHARAYVLEYQEQENRKGFIPERDAEYVNLFLVRQANGTSVGRDGAQNRYLVVDLWRYYPERGIKTCHQWTIWEGDPERRPTRASFRFLVEDLNNVVLDERSVSLHAHTLALLGDFYVKTKRFLANKVRARPGKASTKGSKTNGARVLVERW